MLKEFPGEFLRFTANRGSTQAVGTTVSSAVYGGGGDVLIFVCVVGELRTVAVLAVFDIHIYVLGSGGFSAWVFTAMLRNEVGWFNEEENSADTLSMCLENDATFVRAAFSNRLSIVIQAAIIVVVLIGMLLQWRLALVALATLPVLTISAIAQKLWLAGFSRGIQEMHRKASLVLEDAVRNIYTVVAFCAGNVMTASAHIITAVIGSGVLSLAWAIAQLGWVVGPIVIVMFSIVTYYTSCLLVACYRDPVTVKRNSTYSAAVRNHLGGFMYKVLGVVQRVNLYGSTIGFSITACISMVAIRRNACVHKHGEGKPCLINRNPYMIAIGVREIILSQVPNFDKLSWLSIVAAIMSFTYSRIGLAIGIAKVAETGTIQGSLTGVTIGVQVNRAEKIWRIFQALGDIAFAYSFAIVLIEIEDTVKSPPSEAKTMKTASKISLSVASVFYILCGCFGYAAFGDLAPGNILTSAGFFNPSWLIDIANAAIVIHLIGAYQVFSQRFYAFVEKKAAQLFPDNHFITKDIKIMSYKLNLFRVVWRTLRDFNHFVIDDLPVLQWRGWISWGFDVLANVNLLPCGDVHCSKEDTKMEHKMDIPPSSMSFCASYSFTSCCWLDCWCGGKSQRLQAIHDQHLRF
ncbi:hypothetical protein ACLB2K_048349 [Fragaria x ananassa]